MGLSDNFSRDRASDDIEKQIADDSGRLKTALPSARCIVVAPLWYTDERPESVDTIVGWAREAAAVIGADYIPGASRWIDGRPEFMAGGGPHSNHDWYAELTTRMDAELWKIGL